MNFFLLYFLFILFFKRRLSDMNLKKFTQKSLEALQDAQSLATEIATLPKFLGVTSSKISSPI